MSSKTVKVLLTTVVLTAAFAGLLWATMQDGTEYYKLVEEVMLEPEAWQGKRLQVHGYAANVMRNPRSLDWRFDIQDSVANSNHTIRAEYNGLVPDTFANDAEVVVSGRLEGNTLIVDANGIMAKCPSKYEAKPSLTTDSATDGGGLDETDGASY